MKKIYSTAQQEYLNAKNAFEEISKVLEKKIQTITVIREIQQPEMEKLVVETGFHQAFEKLTEAETNLINWSHEAIKQEQTYKDNVSHFENMYANLHRNAEARTTVIQLAMKLK
ncbi:hypothetical protein [Paenibacillus gansuensis]|uniref:DUF5082 domain-containing protein n=1 Tax=Paenibacillus gansuensis TaxID=306542 RepID=A0ABW5PLI8_9BACL